MITEMTKTTAFERRPSKDLSPRCAVVQEVMLEVPDDPLLDLFPRLDPDPRAAMPIETVVADPRAALLIEGGAAIADGEVPVPKEAKLTADLLDATVFLDAKVVTVFGLKIVKNTNMDATKCQQEKNQLELWRRSFQFHQPHPVN